MDLTFFLMNLLHASSCVELPLDMCVFPYMVVSPKHPKMIIFSRKTGTTIVGNPHVTRYGAFADLAEDLQHRWFLGVEGVEKGILWWGNTDW